MRAEELIGKLAIRTKPVELGKDIFGNRSRDYSYTSTPIRIVNATNEHVVFDYKGTDAEKAFTHVHVLDNRWADNNWIEYKSLFNKKTEEENKNMKLIDLLIKKANGELQDGTKVVFLNYIFQYNKEEDIFKNANSGQAMGKTWNLDKHLKDEIIIF